MLGGIEPERAARYLVIAPTRERRQFIAAQTDGDQVVRRYPSEIPSVPLSRAVTHRGILMCAAVPKSSDGQISPSFEEQVHSCLNDLKESLAVAGSTLADVLHVTVYLTDMQNWVALNAIWPEYFAAALPSRACIGVMALADRDMMLEMVAVAADRSEDM